VHQEIGVVLDTSGSIVFLPSYPDNQDERVINMKIDPHNKRRYLQNILAKEKAHGTTENHVFTTYL
jgi:hypothetical protein